MLYWPSPRFYPPGLPPPPQDGLALHHHPSIQQKHRSHRIGPAQQDHRTMPVMRNQCHGRGLYCGQPRQSPPVGGLCATPIGCYGAQSTGKPKPRQCQALQSRYAICVSSVIRKKRNENSQQWKRPKPRRRVQILAVIGMTLWSVLSAVSKKRRILRAA